MIRDELIQQLRKDRAFLTSWIHAHKTGPTNDTRETPLTRAVEWFLLTATPPSQSEREILTEKVAELTQDRDNLFSRIFTEHRVTHWNQASWKEWAVGSVANTPPLFNNFADTQRQLIDAEYLLATLPADKYPLYHPQIWKVVYNKYSTLYQVYWNDDEVDLYSNFTPNQWLHFRSQTINTNLYTLNISFHNFEDAPTAQVSGPR